MFAQMFSFEWRYYLRQPSFYVTNLVFFLLPFFATVSDSVQIGGGGNVLVNSSFAITQTSLILGVFSMFLVINFMASTAIRNDSTNMAEILCAKPIKPLSYNLGRFLGSYLVVLVVFSMVSLGILFGSLMPWIDSEVLGPTNLSYYLTTYFYFSVPTLFLFSSLFYVVAIRFKGLMPVYLVAIGLFILYVVTGNFLNEPELRTIAALTDPFGLRTFGDVSRYWTPFERNTKVLELSGVVLSNRLLWVAIAVVALVLFGRLGKMPELHKRKDKSGKKAAADEAVEIPELSKIVHKPSSTSSWQKLVVRTTFEVKQVIMSAPFLILVLFSLFTLISQFQNTTAFYGVAEWPLTQVMISNIGDSFNLMMLIVVAYYSAEVVWRERGAGIGDIVDSMPVFNFTFWLSKLIAVWFVFILLLSFAALVAIGNQLISGYTNIELSQYVIRLFYFTALPWGLLTILAFFIQVLSPNKFIGMLIFVAYIMSELAFDALGLEHNLVRYGSSPNLEYSDMNGFGKYLQIHTWYMLYWLSLGIVLTVVGYGLWQRGPQVALKARFGQLFYQMGRIGKLTTAGALLVFVATGSFIYYNTAVLNNFVSTEDALDLREAFERDYVQYREHAIPTIIKTNIAVDLYPTEHRIEATANVVIENRSGQPISKFLVNIPQYTNEWEVAFDGGQVTDTDTQYDVVWFEFSELLMPDERREGVISVVREHKGFEDGNFDWTLVENGTFINNGQLLPTFGLNEGAFIGDLNERRKRGLPAPKGANDLDDADYFNESFFGQGFDFIDFETTISTEIDQTAIAPGYLQKQWVENDRQYFHYKMDAPMINFYSFLSARLEVKKDNHNGIAIEVYYHPEHDMNVDIMIQSVKDSIDYFTEAFGPYQHRQMRIIEFPGYRSFAQSFANTVPYSEQIGFIADLRDPDNIDPVYYVTAHEVAHQWWGHQVGAANVQGSNAIVESLSQYSALMVMEKKYGPQKLRSFLKYELDRYLRGRTAERDEEMPFMRTENQQYIHYNKGSVVTMSIRDRLGEERMNTALKEFLNEYKFSNDPYPTTQDLLAVLQSVATPEEGQFIEQLFSEIALYDLRTKSVEAKELDDGQYEITFVVSADRFIANGQGEEEQVDLDELIDIALFSADPDDLYAQDSVLYQQKHRVKSGENTFVIVVDKMPVYAGIDPFVKLIDRDSNDNITKL